MALQLSVSISYKDLFDDYDQVNISDFLKDIPTVNSLIVICHFLTQLHTIERDSSKQIEFIRMWGGRMPADVLKKINDFIGRISKSKNADYNFINNISGMLLIEKILENANELPETKDLTPEQELNLFKAYAFCCQIWLDNQMPGFKIPEIKNGEDLAKILLPTQMPFQEILEFKDFRMQFIKAIYFFRFCESDAQFKEYLAIFLKEYQLDSWQQYLVNLVSLYVRKFERLKTPSVINISDEFPDIRSFIDQLSIDVPSFKPSPDFLTLREKPVYKIDKENFIFLNLNFLVDKIFQGIQFDFARVLVKNGATYNGKPIKNTGDFMGIFGNEFSENGMFYNIMHYAFERSGYLLFEGEKMKAIIGDGEPDFYIRDKQKVYLFEFKNIYLGTGVKQSNNYETIVQEIFTKMVANQKGKPKGVTQLANVIEKIRSGEFNKFDDIDFDNCIIYPVIVYVDFSFNLAGINHILNKEFRKILKERNIRRTENIKNLTLVDLDSFIKFQDLFRNKSVKLNNLFNEFHEFISNKNDPFNSISTFNMHIHHKTAKMNYDTPKMLFDEVLKLLPKAKE